MPRIGQYKHITVDMPLNLEGIAERLVGANYGVHNMLSAIVIAYKRKHAGHKEHEFDIVPKIERHLNAGDF